MAPMSVSPNHLTEKYVNASFNNKHSYTVAGLGCSHRCPRSRCWIQCCRWMAWVGSQLLCLPWFYLLTKDWHKKNILICTEKEDNNVYVYIYIYIVFFCIYVAATTITVIFVKSNLVWTLYPRLVLLLFKTTRLWELKCELAQEYKGSLQKIPCRTKRAFILTKRQHVWKWPKKDNSG